MKVILTDQDVTLFNGSLFPAPKTATHRFSAAISPRRGRGAGRGGDGPCAIGVPEMPTRWQPLL